MAVDLTNDLYRLMEADLANVGLYPQLKPFQGRVKFSPVLFPAFGKSPYIVVTPGTETGDEERGENRDLDVLVWVVTGIMRDGYTQPELLSSKGIPDGGTLVRAVRQSLRRVFPYQPASFGANPYPNIPQARRDSIITAKYVQTGPYEVVPQPKNDPDSEEVIEDLHLARPITMRYELVEID